MLVTACKPLPVHCKSTTYKYDHQTKIGPITKTWFTLYNKMRFCYNGQTVTSIVDGYTDNYTTAPTFPYVREGVTATTRIESYGSSGRKRAYNASRHGFSCAKILGGFDIMMYQRGYPDGSVTQWHGPIDKATDC